MTRKSQMVARKPTKNLFFFYNLLKVCMKMAISYPQNLSIPTNSYNHELP